MALSINTNALKEQIRKLYNAYTLLIKENPDNRYYIERLEKICKSIELIETINGLNAVCIAGMQGSGKTTLIKTLYELDKAVLRISAERGEATPIIIRESASLNENEATAKRFYFNDLNGAVCVEDIDVNDISEKSRTRDHTIYLELTLPRRYFSDDSGAFVVLPGFEKEDADRFDEEYNSFINCSLQFSKSVVFVTDGQGIANKDICVLIDMLQDFQFDGSNSVFAITKCDSTMAENYEAEVKNTLINTLKEQNFIISDKQIVCCGEYQEQEKNDVWIERLNDAINSIASVSEHEKLMTFFEPLINDTLVITKSIEDDLNNMAFGIKYIESPIKEEVQKEIDRSKAALETNLNEAAEKALLDIYKNIEDVFGDPETANLLKDKKFLFIKKRMSTINENRRTVTNNINNCFTDGNGNNIFQKEVIKRFYTRTFGSKQIPCLEDNADNIALLAGDVTDVEAEPTGLVAVKQQKVAIIAPYLTDEIAFAGDASENKDEKAALINRAYNSYFMNYYSISNNKELQPFIDDFKHKTPADLKMELKKNKSKLGSIRATATVTTTVLDMVDGRPDILTSILGIGTEAGAGAGIAGLLSTPVGMAIAAISAVSAVGVGSVMIHNNTVNLLDANQRTAKIQMRNAIYSQSQAILDAYDDGCSKLLEQMDSVERKRHNIGRNENRILNATYAIKQIEKICQDYIDELKSN